MRSSAARFETAVARLLRREGGYVDHPSDKGGKTKYGISLRFAQVEAKASASLRALLDLDMDGDVDGADIRALTPTVARELYRRCFWDRAGCGSLPPPLDELVFDHAVNGGIVAARKLVQRAINLEAGEGAVVVDGVVGAETLAALRVLDPKRVGHAYIVALRSRYQSIAASDPSQRVFLRGWLNRADELKSLLA